MSDLAEARIEDLTEQRDALAAALLVVLRMDVRGHQLQDRLHFSDLGRAILTQCNNALHQAGAR